MFNTLKDIAMHEQTIVTLLSSGAIAVLIKYIMVDFKSKFDAADKKSEVLRIEIDKKAEDLRAETNGKSEKMREEIDGIVYNYLSRFKDITELITKNDAHKTELITQSNKEIMEKLHEVATDVAVMQSNCFLIQEGKKIGGNNG
jgi:transcriptional regulator of heat shock response